MKKQAQIRLLVATVIMIVAALFSTAKADDTTPYFEEAEVREQFKNSEKIIWTNDWSLPSVDPDSVYFENDPTYGNMRFRRMKNRRALVGEHCTVNKLINAVGVGSWSSNMGALTDDDLNNNAQFISVATVGVTVDPIVSVRDMENYYSKGTEAGYCIVASSGNAVLTLDVISVLSIGFYRDGKLLGVKAVNEGQDGSGVALKLIQIPGSDEASIMLTATSDWLFDEISLDRAGGVQVGVGDLLKIRYAFVGDAKEFTITNGGITNYNQNHASEGLGRIAIDDVRGWNPVLLGIPFPLFQSEINKMTDDDLDNYAALTPIIAVGYQGGARFMIKNTDHPDQEAFGEGYEVGFSYKMGAALALDAGAWIRLRFFDRNGNQIQEETVSSAVLGLSLAKGGDGSASVTAQQPFSGCEIRFHTVLGVDLGAMGIHYGFVKPKLDIDHHCPINPTADADLCETQSTFQLRANPEVSVSWTLDSYELVGQNAQAPTVSADGNVTNISQGRFTFKATADDGCYDYVTITSGTAFPDQSELEGTAGGCGEPVVNGMGMGVYELSTSIYGSSGSLLSISDIDGLENILTNDFDTYAEYTSGLSIATNIRILGVKRNDGGLIYDATTDAEAAGRRMGFVVEGASTVLDLSLLQFLQIRCYHNGEEVYRAVVSESNAISAGIAGSNKMLKMRYSIFVPALDDEGQPIQVDEIMLWTSGVLNVGASHLRIYHAFVDDADSRCNDPLGCDNMLLSYKNTHTTINADETKYGSAVSVANVTNNLGSLVDDDLESYMSVVNTVTVGGGTTIAVNMGRTMDYRYQLGVIVDNKTFLAAVQVGNWMTIETYYKGVPTGDKFTDWGVVGADVAGYGDKNYLFLQPLHRYDEMRITVANIVGALDEQRFYGLFVRGDVNNNGIPNCQDPESCAAEPPIAEVTKVCVGDMIIVTAKGTMDTDYKIRFGEPGIGIVNVHSDENGDISYSYQTKTSGIYQMVFCDGNEIPLSSIDYGVHPLQTRWLTGASNSDWNKWDNWSDGAPYCCTDVIISSNARNLPVLGEPENGDEYCCNGIHFEPRSAVENIPSLNYDSAWVEMELPANRYIYVSAPLKSMYTGDMFIPAAMKGVHTGDYFTKLDNTTSPQSRFNPSIYQRLWARMAKGRLWDNGGLVDIEVDETDWSRNFNYLAHLYGMGQGVSIWVDNGNLPETQTFRFRFPKIQTVYNYFSDYDQTMIADETETLVRADSHRFVYETASVDNIVFNSGNYNRTIYNGTSEYTVTLTADEATSMFLIGNPFMSYIDIEKFLTGNERRIASIRINDGTSEKIVTMSMVDGTIVGLDQVKTIAPMQSVLIETGVAATSFNVLLSTDMIKSEITSEPEESQSASMRINVSNSEKEIASVLVINSDAYTTETLFDSEVEPEIAVFGASGNRAYDILPVSDRIPLGIFLDKRDTVSFSFRTANAFPRDEYSLVDNQSGVTYALDQEVVIPEVATSVGRFALVRNSPTTGAQDAKSDDVNVIITANDRIATVNATGKDMKQVAVFDLGGRLVCRTNVANVNEVSVRLESGVQIIHITFSDDSSESYKILAK